MLCYGQDSEQFIRQEDRRGMMHTASLLNHLLLVRIICFLMENFSKPVINVQEFAVAAHLAKQHVLKR